jgi:hypothetical protein
MLTEILPAHMWNLEHTSAWLNVFRGREDAPVMRVGSVSERLDLRTAARAADEEEP